ncbi:MAG: hypothetical protein AAFR28_00350 [Pseudomonadota bacterium]
MNRAILVAAALLCAQLAPLSAQADVRTLMMDCVDVPTKMARLKCYDTVSEVAGLTEPEEADPLLGKWRVREEVSIMDDTTTVFLALKADLPVQGRINLFYPTMILRCSEGQTAAYVNIGMQPDMRFRRSAPITVRFDRYDAFDIRMRRSKDQRALFFEEPEEMIGQLMEHDRFLFRFKPVGSTTKITQFSLTGLGEAVKPLREACGW